MKSSIATIVFTTLLFSGASIASHELGNSDGTLSQSDGHISWHEFRHELNAYSAVTASISENGLVTLNGKVEDGVDKGVIESIARKIRGATEIHNYISIH